MTNSKSKMLKFCACQDRSIAETRAKLKRYMLPEKEIEMLVNQLIEEDFLNDERFAAHFVKSKLNAKGWGYSKIRFHLKQKGISDDIIYNVLSEIAETDWEEQLRNNIEKWNRSNELSQTTYPKLVRFLLSKGFNLSDIMKHINFWRLTIVVFIMQSCITHNIVLLFIPK
jgi:regulatory protein